MAATSVTGVGLGYAKGQKGAKHNTVGAEKLVGPRVVYAKNHTLNSSGDLTIKLPALAGSASDYIVTVTDTNAAAAAATAASLAISGGATTITVKGANDSTVSVLVVKAGLAI